MATAGRVSGLVIQAFRWLGREHLEDAHVRILRKRLSAADKRVLLADRRHAPPWIAEVMRRVAVEQDEQDQGEDRRARSGRYSEEGQYL